jgi:hypothetical protein
MTYKINTTDGNLLSEVPDGTFDTSSSSLTLIGKNVTNFGEHINENFVKLLDSFASSVQPEHAIKGQIWYNTSTGRLNVYDGLTFRAAGSPIVSPVRPIDMIAGDIWINNETNQVWFYDGTDIILTGPAYTSQQGISGFKIETVLDTVNRSHTICLLYVESVVLGLFSKAEFTPKAPIQGYGQSVVKIGFNASTLSGIKFYVTATSAEGLIYDDGTVQPANDFATKEYVDNSLRDIALSLDITGLADNAAIAAILYEIAPPVEHPNGGYATDGTKLRLHSITTTLSGLTRQNKLFILTNGIWVFSNNF